MNMKRLKNSHTLTSFLAIAIARYPVIIFAHQWNYTVEDVHRVLIFTLAQKHSLLKLYAAEPVYDKLQGKKDLCLSEKKSIKREAE